MVRADGFTWAASIVDVTTMEAVSARRQHQVFSTASVPKILLLAAAADMFQSGDLEPGRMLPRPETIGGAGLWQHLIAESLSAADAAALVGACSDNMATNALIEEIGLDGVRSAAQRYGCRDTALNDVVRNARIPGVHPDRVSQGSAAELAGLCARLQSGSVSNPAASQVIRWLSVGMDHSMALSPFGFDPLSANPATAWNKTGTDTGVRADTGVVSGPRGVFAYAGIANWGSGTDGLSRALGLLNALGCRLKDLSGL